jgi:Ca-activated chloride channel family protein
MHDIYLGAGGSIPQGLRVQATVEQLHRSRPITFFDRSEMKLRIDNVQLEDGTRIPLKAAIRSVEGLPAGLPDDRNGVFKGKKRGRQAALSAAAGASHGALVGGPAGAAVFGAHSLLSGLRQSRDIYVRPGAVFEVELLEDLTVPALWIDRATTPPVDSGLPQVLASCPTPFAPSGALSGGRPVELQEVSSLSSSRIKDFASPANSSTGGATFKVDVDLVNVDVVVRNSRGRLIDDLKEEDFLVVDEGAPQKVTHFSRDLLPLDIALVVDCSGSVAPYLQELRRAALETMALLKPEDRVALFVFTDRVWRLIDLTSDRDAVSERLLQLSAGGGTNIHDAVFDAAQYLRTAAPERRRAIILISDNQASVIGRASERGAIRGTLEAEAVVYSIKTRGMTPIRPASAPQRFPRAPSLVCDPASVNRIATETGGEVLAVQQIGSLSEAMASLVERLKKRYTLGYSPEGTRKDGRFHRLEVKLAHSDECNPVTIFARSGYFAPLR